MNYELKECLSDLQSALGSHYGAAFAHKRVAIIEQEIAEILADNAKQGKDLAALAACNAGYAERERELLELTREVGNTEDQLAECAEYASDMTKENEDLRAEVERLKLKVQIEESKSRACMDVIREMAGAPVRLIALRTPPDFHIEKEMD